MIKKWFKYIVICGVLLTCVPDVQLNAQCPMCRISAETNMKYGGSEGRGLNKGILFILSLPYVLVGGIGYVWYRNRTLKRKEEELGEV